MKKYPQTIRLFKTDKPTFFLAVCITKGATITYAKQ
jgi:hypothetical protein